MTQLFHRMIRHDEGQDPEGVMESKPHAEGSDRSVTVRSSVSGKRGL